MNSRTPRPEREPEPPVDRVALFNIAFVVIKSISYLTLLWINEFKNPWYVLSGLLILVALNKVSIVYSDTVESWVSLGNRALKLPLLAAACLISRAGASGGVFFLISCGLIVWGGVFEPGLDIPDAESPCYATVIYTWLAFLKGLDFLVAPVLFSVPFLLGMATVTWALQQRGSNKTTSVIMYQPINSNPFTTHLAAIGFITYIYVAIIYTTTTTTTTPFDPAQRRVLEF